MSIDIPSGTIIDSGATSPTYEDQILDIKVGSPNFVSKLTENLLGLLSPDTDTDSEMQSNWSEPKDELAVVEWSHWDHPDDSDAVFCRTYRILYHKFGNMVFFGQET